VGSLFMNGRSFMCKDAARRLRFKMLVLTLALTLFGSIASNVIAQSTYIPNGVPTVTSTLTASIASGRVGVDKAGNVFYINHASPYTLYELPATAPGAPVPLIYGLAATGSNAAFVDAGGVLWVTVNAGNRTLIEIPAINGIPNTALITGNGSYSSAGGGLAASVISTACTAVPTAPCSWGNSSIATNVTSSISAIVDVYSDGGGNVYFLDDYDATSSGGYDRIIRFNTNTPATGYLLADSLGVSGGGQNTVAQLTVAGDGNVYYVDSITHGGATGTTYLIGSTTATTAGTPRPVGSTASLGSAVEVLPGKAVGVSTDPWGNLIIAGTLQISEVPFESGSLNFVDEFGLVNASGQTAPNFPMAPTAGNINYGGTFDIHGGYYYASSANVMQEQIGGYNFGPVPVGTLSSTVSVDYFINLSVTNKSYAFPTMSMPSLSAANYASLQSFPYGGAKSYTSGGSSYGLGSQQYASQSFQPAHAGSLRGSFQLLLNTGSNTPWVTANFQGVGVGPQTFFLPGTATQAIVLAQLGTTPAQTAIAKSFTPAGLGVDTFGDIYVADGANHTLDVNCLATTTATAQASTANPTTDTYCQTKAGSTGNIFELSTAFVTPVGVALDGANNVYVLDSSNSAGTNPVTKLLPGLNSSGVINDAMVSQVIVPAGATVAGTALSSPQGITIDGYSNIYIADTGNNRIVQAHQFNAPFSQNVVYVSNTVTFGGTALSGPTGLAVNAAGDLFIADTKNNRIVEYSVTGVASVVSISGITLKAPNGVSVLTSGALIVSDTNNIVSLVDAGVGTALTFPAANFSTLTPGTAAGVTLDLFGNIYVSDSKNSRIVELNVTSPANGPLFPSRSVGTSSADANLYVYNVGTSALTFSAAPSLSSTASYTIDSGMTTCATSSAVPAASNCALAVYFTPQSLGILTTTAVLTDNQPVVSGTSSITYGYKGVFAASSSQTALFSSSLAPQNITFANPGAQTAGMLLALVGSTNTPANQNLLLSFASSTTSVCTVSGTTSTGFTANFIASGGCTITASAPGNTIYAPASLSQTFTVNGMPQTITFNPIAAQLYVYGMTVPLSASTTATALTVIFTVDPGTTINPRTGSSICTVSGTTVGINATGTCIIDAYQAGTSVYAAATQVNQSFTISNPAPLIANISTANVSWGAPTFTLTLNGSSFIGSPVPGATDPSSTIYWDSSPLVTTYVSPTQLTAVVHVGNTDYAGIHAITVQSPAPGGGTSNALQFEVDSEFTAPTPPNFTAPTATVTAGSSATYPVTLPSTATNVSASCLNLPTGTTCSYASNMVSIATTASTPKGTYQIVVVFTETVAGASIATAFVLLPILLMPIAFARTRLASRGVLLTACIGLLLLTSAAFVTGCGGSTASQTHQVTSSAAVTLTVQ
jgi:hypothetical protein